MRRSLTIRTTPPGALVYVNDQLKGESPVTYDFQWYGWHRVTIRKDGYERLEDRQLLRAPMHLWIPFDLAMELVPFTVRDARAWDYALTQTTTLPAPEPPPAVPAVKPAAQAPQPRTDEAEAAPPAAVPKDEEGMDAIR